MMLQVKRLMAEVQIRMVVTSMTETLIRKKVLYRYRLLGIYFIVAIDGTGTISFSRPHCLHCLTRTSNGKTLYYHPVLEAKIVSANGFAFSWFGVRAEGHKSNRSYNGSMTSPIAKRG